MILCQTKIVVFQETKIYNKNKRYGCVMRSERALACFTRSMFSLGEVHSTCN